MLALGWEMVGLGVVALLIFLILFFAQRYKRCPSNKILVVFGKGVGGGASRSRHDPAIASGDARQAQGGHRTYSTVTDFARLRGLSTSVPRASAAW